MLSHFNIMKIKNSVFLFGLFFLVLVSWPLRAQVFLNPGEIVTSADYPADAVARGDHGITTFRLDIKQDGAVSDCEIEASTATPELDAIVCRLMLQRAKFDLSATSPAQESAKFSIPTVSPGERITRYTNRVRWTPPVRQFPRILFDDVKLRNQAVSKSNQQHTRCEFSDGVIIFVIGTFCFVESETRLSASGEPSSYKNILREYLDDFEKNPNAENSFNIAVLLLDNNYIKNSLYYLEISSKFNNSLASLTLCDFYSNKSISKYIEFNTNKAIKYCILSYNQGYHQNVVSTFQSILSTHFDRTNPDVAKQAQITIVNKSIDALPALLRPGNQILRSWDYPKEENKRNIGGVTVVSLLISKEGKVASCLVSLSSYNYALDQRVCERMKTSAFYRPAVVDGHLESYWVNQTVRWNPGGPTRLDPASIFIRLLLGIAGVAI